MKKVILIGMLCVLAGCGSTKGWRVSFGVAPVGSLDDRQGLTEEAKYAKR